MCDSSFKPQVRVLVTNNLDELPLIQSQRAQGLPLESPPVVGESQMEATDQGATTDSHVEWNLVV